MNNSHNNNYGFNNRSPITAQNQYPTRTITPRFNYQPPFNHEAQRPTFAGAPNISNFNHRQTSTPLPLPFNVPQPPASSHFNIAQPNRNQSENVPSSQHSYSQPHFRMGGEQNIKQPPNYGQSLNIPPTTISSSSPHITTTPRFPPTTISSSSPHIATTPRFPPNYSTYPSQAQPMTHNTSFQPKESYSNNLQYQIIPPPPNSQITRPSNMPPNLPPPVNYQATMTHGSYKPNFALPPPPTTGMVLTQNVPSQSTPMNHSSSFPFVPPAMPSLLPQAQSFVPPAVVKPVSEKESKILSFLEKFTCNEKKKSINYVTVAQFRATIKQGLSLVKKLMICKNNLSQLLHSDEKEWNLEVNKVIQYQNQLAEACKFLTTPKYLNCIHKKLELIKKKRNSVKKVKQNMLNERVKKLKEREQLNQEIDKWLDSIKEKNLKLKRETEMKKEADSILSEVRRKIQEAKRTIEKIKVFEKLRNTRQSNAAKKGLFLPEHDERFQKSISNLKETVYRQLSHYETEEKALKVMLEAEQEGQLEEEAKWKIKRLRTLQQKRQNNIVESLFGDSIDEPEEDEPIYLFYQFQNSGNKSIENLVQIRHQWDIHASESGEPVPHQWVVPAPPTTSGWEVVLNT